MFSIQWGVQFSFLFLLFDFCMNALGASDKEKLKTLYAGYTQLDGGGGSDGLAFCFVFILNDLPAL